MEAIYAVDMNNGLSKNGMIPWNSKKDMNFFRTKTINNIVIMGSKTFLSLQCKPLKNRLNVVLTSNRLYYTNNDIFSHVIFTNNMNNSLINDIMNNREYYLHFYPFLSPDYKIYIIGGKQIYDQYIDMCDKVWVTRIKRDYDCDLFFSYDYKDYKETIVEDCNELTISVYDKQ
jgi:dihydrofolate reductase